MLFIAEIGLNHNGHFGLIQELVRQAALSGADIAKFQLGWRSGEGEMNALTEEVLTDIIRFCEHYEIEPMFSIFTDEAYDLIRKFDVNRYKIASRTVVDNPKLVESIIAEGKEVFVSLGFWEEDRLPFGLQDNVKYFYTKSVYPCPPWEAVSLPKLFSADKYFGYSDHTIGIETSLLAISRGAGAIERHFTLDKSDTTIRDHALSSTPDEFRQLVELGRAMVRCLAIGV